MSSHGAGGGRGNGTAGKGSAGNGAGLGKHGQAVAWQGTLRKQGHVMHNWKTRFFVLSGTALTYYTEEHGRKKGFLGLQDDLTCKHESVKQGYGFRVTSGRQTLLLSAATADDRDAWTAAIAAATAATPVEGGAVVAMADGTSDAGTGVGSGVQDGADSTASSSGSWLWGSTGHSVSMLKFLRPELQAAGMLRVRVIAAEDLMAKDSNGSSDPYAIIKVGNAEARTKVIKKSLAPEWNETFEFPFSRRIRFVRVDLFDHDMVGKHDFLGRCLIPVAHVTDTPWQEWYPVGKRSHKSHVKGRVFLEFSTSLPRDKYVWQEFGFVRRLARHTWPLIPDSSTTTAARSGGAGAGLTKKGSASRHAAANSTAMRGTAAILQDMPPEQSENVEDMAEVRLRSHLGTAGVEAKGTLFLTNYRLIFVSTASVCTRVERRSTTAVAASASTGTGAGGSAGAGAGPAAGGAARAGDGGVGDGSSKAREEGGEDMVVDVALDEASGTHTAFWSADLSTSVPLGHVATMTAGKDPTTQLDHLTILCKDFRTLVFVFEPVHTVPPPSTRMTPEEWRRASVRKTSKGDSTGRRAGMPDVLSALSVTDNAGSNLPRPAPVSQIATSSKSFFVKEGRAAAARFYARLYHCTINMSCVAEMHANLHADSLMVLQAMHEAVRVKPTPEEAGGGGSTKRTASRRATLRRAASSSTLMMELVAAAYTSLASAWTVYDPRKEFARMGVPNAQWRLTAKNSDYALSAAYPSVLAVPVSIDDEHLANAAPFRSKGRLPALSWRHPVNGATITRSSQPMVGLSNNRSAFDEALLEAIRQASKSPAMKLVIVDARPKLNARANKTQGKGFENTGPGTAYPNCDLVFCNIGNIHVMRRSLDALRAVCNTPSTPNNIGRSFADDKVAAEVTQTWLMHVSKVISAAVTIVQYVDEKGVSTLVHCSDGWDRTAQLCALSELLMDPYYRTIEGFEVLVEREWVSFGHKFADRCGWSSKGFQSSDRSPIFLQFLDCVHQCIVQFPDSFEFDVGFLCDLADHVYSGWFGTFLFNSERERRTQALSLRSLSVWALLNAQRAKYLNPRYRKPSDDVLRPIVDGATGRKRRVWAQGLVLMPCASLRHLHLWSKYYLHWDSVVERVRWQMSSVKGWAAQATRRDQLRDMLASTVDDEDADTGGADGATPATRRSVSCGSKASSKTRGGDGTSGCAGCGTSFGFFRRRKICASCGNTFCTACCSLQRHLLLEDRGDGATSSTPSPLVRVCKNCAARIDLASPSSRTRAATVTVLPNARPAAARAVAASVSARPHVGRQDRIAEVPGEDDDGADDAPAPPLPPRPSIAAQPRSAKGLVRTPSSGPPPALPPRPAPGTGPAAAASNSVVLFPSGPRGGAGSNAGAGALHHRATSSSVSRRTRRPTSIGLDPRAVADAAGDDDQPTSGSESDEVDDDEEVDVMEHTLTWIEADEGAPADAE